MKLNKTVLWCFGLGLVALGLCIVLWEQCVFYRDFGVLNILGLKVPQYCLPKLPRPISVPSAPYISFNYANAEMPASNITHLIQGLTAGAIHLDQLAPTNSQLAMSQCSYSADRSTGLTGPSAFSGAASGAHPFASLRLSSLPSPANTTSCRQAPIPSTFLITANHLTALNQLSTNGIANITWATGTSVPSVEADTQDAPPCGFFQFTPTELDPTPDGSGNLKTVAGDFAFLLRGSCAGTPSDPDNVVVVWNGYLVFSQ